MSHIMQANNKLGTFKQWCNLVLPLVYDDTLSYYEVLDKVVVYLNKTTKSVKSIYPILDEMIKEISDMKDVIDNLDDVVDETVAEYLNSEEFLNRLRTLTGQIIQEYLTPIEQALAQKANLSDVPTKTSQLTNDSGFITSANVPTKTSQLTNDSGFVTSSDIPTKTSELTNDSGFITSSDVPTKTSELTNDSGFITSSALTPYQTKTDNTLATTSKTVVGAINELRNNANGTSTITNTNLNTLTVTANYYLNGVGTDNNSPIDYVYGILEVIKTPVTLQRITSLGPTGTSNKTYERIYINGAWTSWRTFTRS